LSDFTGERLIPGQVDADLWNEHISRYFFALSLCKNGERVLDAGCGTGYGASLLNRRSHAAVLGIDVSPDAINHALREYASAGAQFAIGRCESLPVREGSMDLVTAFEVIEHLDGWREFLVESRRVLAANGLLLVSTPNRSIYAESRGDAGPNPFHVHEFDFNEFSRELAGVFPHVRIFGQNHTGTITLTALGEAGIAAERESLHVSPESAGYLVAVCSKAELPPISNFVFVPEAANTLLERDRHIRLLTQDFTTLFERLRLQDAELKRSNEWAQSLDLQLTDAGKTIGQLQTGLERSNQWARSLNAQIEEAGLRIAQVQTELERSNEWGNSLNHQLSDSGSQIARLQFEVNESNAWANGLDAELASARARIFELQSEVETKNQWALSLQQELEQQTGELAEANVKLNSTWVRVGKALRIGPLAQ
jgi:SAM-dependent methyltransferase